MESVITSHIHIDRSLFVSVRVYCSAIWASGHDLSTATYHKRSVWAIPSRADGRFICRFDRYRNRKLYQISDGINHDENRDTRSEDESDEFGRSLKQSDPRFDSGRHRWCTHGTYPCSAHELRPASRHCTRQRTQKSDRSLCAPAVHIWSRSHMTCRKLKSHGSVQYRSRDIH